MSADDDDLALLASAAADGDRDAFTALIERTAPVIFSLTRSILGDDDAAKDVVQETAIRVWQKLPSIREHRATVGWMCRIARNLCTDRMRFASRRKTQPLAPEEMQRLRNDLTEPPRRPDDALADRQAYAALMSIVLELKPKYREVFLLTVVEERTAAEVATMLGCPLGTIESRLSRARKMLVGKLERLSQRERSPKTGVAQ